MDARLGVSKSCHSVESANKFDKKAFKAQYPIFFSEIELDFRCLTYIHCMIYNHFFLNMSSIVLRGF